MVKWFEELSAIADSLMICKFGLHALHALGVDDTAAVIYAATGWRTNAKDLMKIGERIINLERLCDLREGITRKDDTLPPRYLEEPLPEGASKGQTVELEPMLERYYELGDWDKEYGRPSAEKLKSLGIP